MRDPVNNERSTIFLYEHYIGTNLPIWQTPKIKSLMFFVLINGFNSC